ncbi:hypothetical protein BDK51DRAFT_51582 [Blyttiomyces helicus]|uniref:Uncharacterized protein n=1 Tax=Blyttiomyces helicus TaxID=388810 RepID=A0A4P9W4G8_9FUNG|nr:hypothetical protein BDK51DRAFT_51582 [Blyttiomyces helicus]|eukprot:RKO87249.1 hypothetical protein BDK51DRAFT_51582 [Blyttiomyces helicus]
MFALVKSPTREGLIELVNVGEAIHKFSVVPDQLPMMRHIVVVHGFTRELRLADGRSVLLQLLNVRSSSCWNRDAVDTESSGRWTEHGEAEAMMELTRALTWGWRRRLKEMIRFGKLRHLGTLANAASLLPASSPLLPHHPHRVSSTSTPVLPEMSKQTPSATPPLSFLICREMSDDAPARVDMTGALAFIHDVRDRTGQASSVPVLFAAGQPPHCAPVAAENDLTPMAGRLCVLLFVPAQEAENLRAAGPAVSAKAYRDANSAAFTYWERCHAGSWRTEEGHVGGVEVEKEVGGGNKVSKSRKSRKKKKKESLQIEGPSSGGRVEQRTAEFEPDSPQITVEDPTSPQNPTVPTARSSVTARSSGTTRSSATARSPTSAGGSARASTTVRSLAPPPSEATSLGERTDQRTDDFESDSPHTPVEDPSSPRSPTVPTARSSATARSWGTARSSASALSSTTAGSSGTARAPATARSLAPLPLEATSLRESQDPGLHLASTSSDDSLGGALMALGERPAELIRRKERLVTAHPDTANPDPDYPDTANPGAATPDTDNWTTVEEKNSLASRLERMLRAVMDRLERFEQRFENFEKRTEQFETRTTVDLKNIKEQLVDVNLTLSYFGEKIAAHPVAEAIRQCGLELIRKPASILAKTRDTQLGGGLSLVQQPSSEVTSPLG